MYGQVTLTKRPRPFSWGRTDFPTSGAREIGHLHATTGRGPYLTPDTKINSKCIGDLSVRARALRNMEADIYDLRLARVFLNRTPKAQATKENINLTSEKFRMYVPQRTLSRK